MGVEAQLFEIKLPRETEISRLESILKQLNVKKRKPNFKNSQNYEIYSEKGIIEMQVFFEDSRIKEFFVRFSYGNPKSVIDETFYFLKQLSERISIEIFSFNPLKKIKLDKKSLSALQKEILRKKEHFDLNYFKINKPIRGGKETFDYIRKLKNEPKN
jgi:hypothetical protein